MNHMIQLPAATAFTQRSRCSGFVAMMYNVYTSDVVSLYTTCQTSKYLLIGSFVVNRHYGISYLTWKAFGWLLRASLSTCSATITDDSLILPFSLPGSLCYEEKGCSILSRSNKSCCGKTFDLGKKVKTCLNNSDKHSEYWQIQALFFV